jgi:hypothetical protein
MPTIPSHCCVENHRRSDQAIMWTPIHRIRFAARPVRPHLDRRGSAAAGHDGALQENEGQQAPPVMIVVAFGRMPPSRVYEHVHQTEHKRADNGSKRETGAPDDQSSTDYGGGDGIQLPADAGDVPALPRRAVYTTAARPARGH